MTKPPITHTVQLCDLLLAKDHGVFPQMQHLDSTQSLGRQRLHMTQDCVETNEKKGSFEIHFRPARLFLLFLGK